LNFKDDVLFKRLKLQYAGFRLFNTQFMCQILYVSILHIYNILYLCDLGINRGNNMPPGLKIELTDVAIIPQL